MLKNRISYHEKFQLRINPAVITLLAWASFAVLASTLEIITALTAGELLALLLFSFAAALIISNFRIRDIRLSNAFVACALALASFSVLAILVLL